MTTTDTAARLAHTPGGWTVVPQSNGDQLIVHIKDPTGRAMRIIGLVYSRAPSAVEDAANARLIAAAPELLAALIEAEQDIRECLVTSDWPATNIAKDPRLLRYKAAIAKATGLEGEK